MLFIPSAQREQYPFAFGAVRFVHVNDLESPFERRVALYGLFHLARGGRADKLYFPARQRRLKDVRGVHRALRRARADERVYLVNEQYHIAGVGSLSDNGAKLLLEFAAVFCPRNQTRHIQRYQPLADKRVRHALRRYAQSKRLGNRGFADSRLADQQRIVFAAAEQYLNKPFFLLFPSDDRVDLTRRRTVGKRHRIAVQSRCCAARIPFAVFP